MVRELVLDWQAKLGYARDPFEDRFVLPVSASFVGAEKEREKINLFILKGQRFGTIHGDAASGKSVLLRWVAEQVERGKEHLDVALVEEKENLVDERKLFAWLLRGRLHVLERLVTRPHEKLSRDEQEKLFFQGREAQACGSCG
ncbi:MAG: hypothetical protein HC945_02365 [Nitrosarchaeum sp.]|nr:hypothetical protein [Nitrosarchaeum sp.]